MHRRHILLLPVVLVAGRAAHADTGTATDFVRQLGRDFAATVQGATSTAERRTRLIPFLQRIVDIEATARFCLGRYWLAATPAQQHEYLDLFVGSLAGAVAIRADTYSAEKSEITVLPEVKLPEGVAVKTVVRNPGQQPVTVTWLVDTDHQPFHIADVQAEGISLRQTLRSDYTSYLRRNGGNLDQFLQALRATAKPG